MENTDKVFIEKYVERLNKSTGLNNIKRNIEDNKIFWSYKEIEYRLKMPSYGERKIIDNAKKAKYLELAGKVPCEDELIKQLAQSGKSIKKIRAEIKNLEMDKEKYQELLAKEAKTDPKHEDKKAIKETIDEIEKIVYKQVVLNYEIIQLLSPSIENQIKDIALECVILNLFDKKVEDKWVKVYEDKTKLDAEEDSVLLDNAVEMAANLGIYNA